MSFDIFLFLFLLGCAVAFFMAAQARHVVPQEWHWERLLVYLVFEDAEGWHFGLLLKGLISTIKLGIWSGILALTLGGVAGIYLASAPRTLTAHALSSFFIFLRNTPPLVLLFLLYFVTSAQLFSALDLWARSAPMWLQNLLSVAFADPSALDKMLAAVLTLGCYQGAYVAEIVRAGLQALPHGQWDAGAALGFSPLQCFFLVLLPQSLPLILPPMAGQCISIFKDSALASLISVPELTFQGMEIMAISRLPFETWFLVALLYFFLSFVCARIFWRMEKSLVWAKGSLSKNSSR